MSRKISLFFDNDPGNFIDCHRCKNVKPIQIPETTLTNPNSLTFTTKKKYRQFINTLSPQAKLYAKHLKLLNNSQFIDSLDPVSGVSDLHINYIINNIKPSRIKALIFDWDRTLSKFEGIYAIRPRTQQFLDFLNLKHPVTTRHIAEYYLGGRDRIKQLRILWKWCNHFKIQIYILSSNPSIGTYPYFFLDLLKSVNLNVKKKHLIFRGNLTKYQYIQKYLPFL